jgi:hypothetical protein
MKKLILLASTLLISSLALVAQSTLLVTNASNGGSTITNGMVIHRTVAANGMDLIGIDFKNISTTTKTYKMRMFYDTRFYVVGAVNDTSNPYFCFGPTCYPVNKMISNPVTLNANQDSTGSSVHYDETVQAGYSSIRYRLYETSTASTDYMEFTIKYNDPTASIKTNASVLSYVSEVFPNPSNTKASIVVNTLSDLNTSIVSITNTLGSVVSSKSIELLTGRNTISLDVETLSSGIYFATITTGNFKTVKKFTINK